MGETRENSPYDGLAWFYDRYWGGSGYNFHSFVMGALDKVLLLKLPPGARILDLCCGTGHLTKMLFERGFKVVGADCSIEMLRFAKRNTPAAGFFATDARSFFLPARFDAVVSTFDSMNHIMEPRDLERVFRNVKASLCDGGVFAFDLLLEEAYEVMWKKSGFFLEDDNACLIRGTYDCSRRVASVKLTLFRNDGGWKRSDVTVTERFHPLDEVVSSLESCGFSSIEVHRAGIDFDMPADEGKGRVFISAKKREVGPV
ncbi:MAG: class I SAM-dependent methyltransferase [Deltaproteobacteria bacterium]|nr:class I SAM-dependent methyltransferase [Deltaproteobacteria bacterium]MBZ0219844.1 class I SAM-dependent methyltransferase [Deltaproteobacteria bacterium]